MGNRTSYRPRVLERPARFLSPAACICTAVLASSLALQNANASTLTFSQNYSLNSPEEQFSINQFNPLLGYLNQVDVALSGSGGVWTVVASVGTQSTFDSLGSSVTGGLSGPGGVNLAFSAIKAGTVGGTLSNVGIANGVTVTTSTSGPSASTTITGADLAAYIGTGTFHVPVSVSTHLSSSLSQGQLVSATDAANGSVTFAYHYVTTDGHHPIFFTTSNFSTSSDTSLDISKFDPSLGTLTSVDVTFNTSQTVAGKVAGSGVIGSPTSFVVDAASVTLDLPSGSTLVALPTLPPAYEGTLALDATSGQLMGGSPVDVNLIQTLLASADLAPFIGGGTVNFSLFDSPGVKGYVGDGLFAGSTFNMDGLLMVTYDYSQTPPRPSGVPEPATLALMALGLLALVTVRRRPASRGAS